MFFVQLIIVAIYLFLSLKLPNSFLRYVTTFYVFLLSMQLLMNLFDYEGNNKISIYAILIFNMNIVFFLLGVWICVLNNVQRIGQAAFRNFPALLNIKLLLVIQVVLLLLLYKYYLRYQLMLTLAAADETARQLFFESGRFFSSYSDSLFYLYIIVNYKYVSSLVFAYLLMQKKRNFYQNALMLLSIVFLILISFIGQGRGDLLIPVLSVLLMTLFIRENNPVLYKESVKLKLLLIIFFAFIGISAVTLLRARMLINVDNFVDSFWESIVATFIDYFSFPITAFDYSLTHIFQNSPIYFGRATFAGLEELITTPFLFVDESLHITNRELGALMSPFHNINGQNWNALYTGVVNYYLDFNIAGVVIFPFLLGYFFTRYTFVMLKKSTLFCMIIYFFLFFSMYKNLFSSPFQSLEFWSFLCVLFLTKKLFEKEFKFRGF